MSNFVPEPDVPDGAVLIGEGVSECGLGVQVYEVPSTARKSMPVWRIGRVVHAVELRHRELGQAERTPETQAAARDAITKIDALREDLIRLIGEEE